MPVLFTCPHCETKTQVDDQYLGKQGRCVSCGGQIQTPPAAGDRPRSVGSSKRNFRWLAVVAAVAVVTLVLGGLAVSVFRVGGRTINTLSSNREQINSIRKLEKIAAAMNAYAADHGSYPAAVTRDADGKPMHSWRLTLLPYLGEEALYDQFDLSLPWDHPRNLAISQRVTPAVYLHPSVAYSYGGSAAYFVITGAGTLFPDAAQSTSSTQIASPLGPDDVTDPLSQTLLVVEGAPGTLLRSWTDPVDLPVSLMTGQLAGSPGSEPGGLTRGGVAAVTVDGRGHFIQDTISPSEFMALVTPTGGERLRDDTLD